MKSLKEYSVEEAVKTGNEGRGYHGEFPSEVADKKYSSAHKKVRDTLAASGHMKDVKNPNVTVKHFLDSGHGRHIAGDDSDSNVTSRFKSFKKDYNPKLFEESLDESEDLPIHKHTSPYEGAEVGEYTEIFPHGSVNSAQKFAKHVISKGATARIGKRGADHYVYHKGAGPISKSDWRKTLTTESLDEENSTEKAVRRAHEAYIKAVIQKNPVMAKYHMQRMQQHKRELEAKSGVKEEVELDESPREATKQAYAKALKQQDDYKRNKMLGIKTKKEKKPNKSVEMHEDLIDEGKMSELAADIDDHIKPHIDKYKKLGGAEHLADNLHKAGEKLAKKHGVSREWMHTQVSDAAERHLSEEVEGLDELDEVASHSELAALAQKAHIAAVSQGNIVMANHYKGKHDIHKNLAKIEKEKVAWMKTNESTSLNKEVKTPHDGVMTFKRKHNEYVDGLVKSGDFKYHSENHQPGHPATTLIHKATGKKVKISLSDRDHKNFTHKHSEVNESVSPFDWKKYTAGRNHRDSLTGSTSTFHDVKKTSTGTVYTKQANPDGTNKGSGEDAAKAVAPEAAVKRGRGRPPGKYGSYKARSSETSVRAAALAAASKAKNRALRKEEFTDEFLDEIFSGMNVEGQVQFLLSDDYTQLDELSKSTLGSYIKKATKSIHGATMNGSKPMTYKKSVERKHGVYQAVEKLTK